jgi:Beta-lactamase
MVNGRGRFWRTLGMGLKMLAVLAVLMAGALLYFGIPRNASGMAAKGVCSAAFVAGRPWQNLMAQDMLPASPVLRLISIEVDEPASAVTAKFAGLFARRAVLLPNRGCVLDAAAPPAQTTLPALAPKSATPAAANAAKPWPVGDAPVPASQWGPGVDAPALQKVIDQAFAGAGDPAAANARGVAVIHKGRLLVLQMAPGFSAQTPLHGWSMAKTVTGMLVQTLAPDPVTADKPAPGVPSSDARLRLDANVVEAFPPGREPAWLAAWRNDTRKGIKVSDLLYMRDGLASTEDYQPWGSVPQMLWGQPNASAFAAASPAEAAPGIRWRYLSASANLLAGVARGRFANDADYWAYPAKALFNPIGATTAVMETDTDGNWVGSSYVWASVGDWGRLGQLMLNDGAWGDTQVMPSGWLQRASTKSSPGGEGRAYGAQTWRIGDADAGRCKAGDTAAGKDNATGRSVPPDTLAMSGHWGQIVAMVPSREAVIVRMGWTFKRDRFDDCAFVADVLKALPQ